MAGGGPQGTGLGSGAPDSAPSSATPPVRWGPVTPPSSDFSVGERRNWSTGLTRRLLSHPRPTNLHRGVAGRPVRTRLVSELLPRKHQQLWGPPRPSRRCASFLTPRPAPPHLGSAGGTGARGEEGPGAGGRETRAPLVPSTSHGTWGKPLPSGRPQLPRGNSRGKWHLSRKLFRMTCRTRLDLNPKQPGKASIPLSAL